MSTSIDKIIGRNIRARRRALALTQLELSEKTGLSHQTVTRIERGNHSARRANLESLAVALKCSIEDFYAGTNEVVSERPIDYDRVIEVVRELVLENKRLKRELLGIAKPESEDERKWVEAFRKAGRRLKPILLLFVIGGPEYEERVRRLFGENPTQEQKTILSMARQDTLKLRK